MFDDTDNGDDGSGGEYTRGFHCAILRGHDVVPVANTELWGRWFEKADRRVAQTYLGRAMVSTVFLGLDHNHGGGRPLWFETMVFRGGDFADHYQERFTTWDEAEAGHARALQWERASFPAWVDGPDGLRRVHVVGWKQGIAELENGPLLPCVLVYRNRRRVPLRASTYKRRFAYNEGVSAHA